MPAQAPALTFAGYREAGYFPGLHGVRCIAILAVIWHHVYQGQVVVLLRGFLGVDLFFVLSGFLIVTLMLRERDATGKISLGKFWIRRCARLMPPLFALLAVLAAYYATRLGTPQADRFFRSLPENALYLSNWIHGDANNLGILWSLATEEQFYIVWPIVEILLAWFAWPLLILLIIANQMMNFGLFDPLLSSILPQPLSRYEIIDATYTPICLGVALARLAHRPRSYAILRALLGHAAAPILSFVSVMIVVAVTPSDISGLPRLVIQTLMTVFLATLLLNPHAGLVRLMERPAILRIGTISYGMYLFHLWAMEGAHKALGLASIEGPLPVFLLTVLLTVGVADVSYRLLERPIVAFAHRRNRRPLPADAVTPVPDIAAA